MIGWSHTLSRDYAEAVANGIVDTDLERMAAAIKDRQNARAFPGCPHCGEPLTARHYHDVGGETVVIDVARVLP